ncbi:lysophospholipid acyltransferase family protein [Streptomyces gamaensis]|uniref:Lysophospholipid acyltransferase family protein n=1 Tax=Streptomyces gamaensis TaxID=1763542 RepID=A0ABW0YST5_9ACTN
MPGHLRPVGRVRRWLRAAAVVPFVLVVCGTALAGRRLRRPPTRALRFGFRAILRALGIRLEIHGAPERHQGGTLLVANHISWLDLIALGALAAPRVIAKAELLDSRVMAVLTGSLRCIHLDRNRPRALPPAVAGTTAALRDGATVALFPEATTWCGATGGPYRPAFFQSALDAGAVVRPVVLRYRTADHTPATDVAYVGTPLRTSVHRVLSARALTVELHLLPPLHPQPGDNRRTLAARAQRAADTVRGTHS